MSAELFIILGDYLGRLATQVIKFKNMLLFDFHADAGQDNVQNNDETEKNDRKMVETEFEPTKMVVVRDFSPCVDDELEVKRGQHVKALYQENEWRFVVAEDGKEGFIPYTYCIPIADKNWKPVSKPRDENMAVSRLSELVDNVQHVPSSSSSETDITVHHVLPAENDFVKKHLGQYIVLFDYNAMQEDDISTQRGEMVTVLNKDDPDWYWVRTEDGTHEGFIPRKFLRPMQEENSFGKLSKIIHNKSIIIIIYKTLK